MNREQTYSDLYQALELSRELLVVAEHGDARAVADLDAERLRLLHSARLGSRNILDVDQRRLLHAIDELNSRAIGLLEHRRRRTERQMDTAAVGRRAVAAYSAS